MNLDLHSLIRDNIKVYSVPTIYISLNNAMNNPRSSVTEIGRIISEDQGLTARMLKLANSPLYGYPSRIETISQAVLIIGTKQIRDLALATSVISLFKGIPGGLVSMDTFWRHSIACGVIARVIAGYQRKPNIERFFTVGVLHDIGRLLLFSSAPEEFKKIMTCSKEEKKPLFRLERAKLGFDHSDVGGALLKNWKLSSSLTELVAYHHNPLKAAQHPGETAVIHISDVIAHALQTGNSGDFLVPPLQEQAWGQLKLPIGILPYIVEQSMQQFDIVAGVILQEMQK